jgi:Na+/H+ antiporter NhaD/arsenite permease-like protein
MHPNLGMVVPFVALLALIALAPLYFSDWWGRHYPKTVIALGLVTVGYYLFGLKGGERVLGTLVDYISFICLIGSLFVVSGGIHIVVKGEASPLVNVVFLFVGALISNLLGTTGASMLLIRPWLRMNRYRLTGHHVVLFIFIVSNVGGCLTPVGDPPLFLGYLKGVPFWWVAKNGWQIWLLAVVLLLGCFYLLDSLNFRRAPKTIRELETAHETWRFEGMGNLFFLAVILGSVLIKHPPFLRECLMVGAAAGSWFTTRRSVHQSNHFTFGPIKEVAILFAGIFATMMPALDWLQVNASRFGAPTPTVFFWGSGALSSVLDNAPTYLSFLSGEFGALANPAKAADLMSWANSPTTSASSAAFPSDPALRSALDTLQTLQPNARLAGGVTLEQAQMALLLSNPFFMKCLLAISVGSVFFGANTYIGNGPNFMVKAIADHQKAHTPTFVGYILKFTIPFMLPTLIIIWLLHFRLPGH